MFLVLNKSHLSLTKINTRLLYLGVTPLIAASTEGKSETVQLLLDNGADVNAKNDKGNIFSDICLF